MVRTKNQTKAFAYIKETLTSLYMHHGYYEYSVPIFAGYDLFTSNKGHSRMLPLKLIAPNTDVILLRADATLNILDDMKKGERYKREKYFYNTQIVGVQEHTNTIKTNNQMGIENFSPLSCHVDAEVIMLMIKTLLCCGVSEVRAELSHADFLPAMMDEYKITSPHERETIVSLVSSKNAVKLDEFLLSLGIEETVRKDLCSVCMLFGDFDECIQKAKALCVNEKMASSLEYIKEVYEVLKIFGVEKCVRLDMGLANSMDYYTGIMFHAYAKGAIKEIASGGRYDALSKKVSKRANACGFGIDVDYLIDFMQQDKSVFKRTNKLVLKAPKLDKALYSEIEKLRDMGYFVDLDIDEEHDFSICSMNQRYKSFKEFSSSLKEEKE